MAFNLYKHFFKLNKKLIQLYIKIILEFVNKNEGWKLLEFIVITLSQGQR